MRPVSDLDAIIKRGGNPNAAAELAKLRSIERRAAPSWIRGSTAVPTTSDGADLRRVRAAAVTAAPSSENFPVARPGRLWLGWRTRWPTEGAAPTRRPPT
jgi:hypothetical protein